MADLKVDRMSDLELLAKLTELGVLNTPLSASTREQLKQMLKLVLSEKEKPRKSVGFKEVAQPVAGPSALGLQRPQKELTNKRSPPKSDVSPADSVDSMSDVQLQAKLFEQGYPTMPITSTTRAMLVKKALQKGSVKKTTTIKKPGRCQTSGVARRGRSVIEKNAACEMDTDKHDLESDNKNQVHPINHIIEETETVTRRITTTSNNFPGTQTSQR